MILQVSETGLLDITQGMSRCGGDLGHPGSTTSDSIDPMYNPFNSPHKLASHSPSADAASILAQTASTCSVGSNSTAVVCTTTNATSIMTTASLNNHPDTSNFSNASRHIDFHSKVSQSFICSQGGSEKRLFV